MIEQKDIVTPVFEEKDRYYDLRGLEAYSSLARGTLRDYLKRDLPHYKLRGKILVRKSEFDKWIEKYRLNKKRDIEDMVDGMMNDLEG